MNELGEPCALVLHSTDASAGVAVPIFKDGSVTAYTLAANEYLEITDVIEVVAVSGDTLVHFGTVADTTPDDAKTIARGTVANNGGVARGSHFKAVGLRGEGVFAVAAAGAVDVHLRGYIRQGGLNGVRPSWRE